MGNLIPFDLEKFKAGQEALTRDGRRAKFIGFCEDCKECHKLIAYIYGGYRVSTYYISGRYDTEHNRQTNLDLVSMVSRHQALIDSYDPEDTWQVYNHNRWLNVDGEPSWCESFDYRPHPHNDLIKTYKKGAKIETREVDGMWYEVDTPSFYEDWEYRIKQEPTTHCLVYDAKRFDHDQTRAVRARVVKKEVAITNGWKIIKEWEV